MRFVMFYHSLVSDWNHGNAHFLRGVVGELQRRGHEVVVYEPRDGWSLSNLRADGGEAVLQAFAKAYPHLESRAYDPDAFDLAAAVADADVVVAHEWNEPELIRALGELRAGGRRGAGGLRGLLFFHDTHHRAVTEPDGIARFDLSAYDGVLAFGDVLRNIYLQRGLCARAFTWHEAADASVFTPRDSDEKDGDLVWVGNWGDDERTAELHEFLLEPVCALGLRAKVFGVRYPESALRALDAAGIEYGGFLPNFRVPEVFARYRMTVHVPRRPYTQALPGIPTIRPFEALACGLPLVSAPWEDREGLFRVGRDYLLARDGVEMTQHLAWLRDNPDEARGLAADGRRTLLARHTTAHRVEELLDIVANLAPATQEPAREVA